MEGRTRTAVILPAQSVRSFSAAKKLAQVAGMQWLHERKDKILATRATVLKLCFCSTLHLVIFTFSLLPPPQQREDGRRLHAQLQPEQLPREDHRQRRRRRRHPARRPLRHQREAAGRRQQSGQQHDHRQQVLQQQQQRRHVQRLQGEARGHGGRRVLCLTNHNHLSGTSGKRQNRQNAVMGGRLDMPL